MLVLEMMFIVSIQVKIFLYHNYCKIYRQGKFNEGSHIHVLTEKSSGESLTVLYSLNDFRFFLKEENRIGSYL